MASSLSARIERRITRAGVRGLASDQIAQLNSYLSLLAKWNVRISLTSYPLTPPNDEAIDRLIVEPVVAAERVQIHPSSRMMDLGSGGGSPGIPIRICAPSVKLTLVESKTRKSAFLREASRALGLPDLDVVTARFEELLTKPEMHESADYLSIRAVRADARLWRTVQAFLKPGGSVLWFASSGQDRSFPPPLTLTSTEPLVPASGSSLVVLRKVGPQ